MDIARFLKFLVLVVLPAVVQAPRHTDICGILHSSFALITSFDPGSVPEVRWRLKTSQNEVQIAKFPSDQVTDGQTPKYKLLNNGTKLVKENMTKEDIGVYTSEARFLDGELRSETFNVTACVQAPRHTDICGFLHSSIALITSFDPGFVQEVGWTNKSSQNEVQIAKFQLGQVTDGQTPKYKLLNNGTKLVKENMTKEDIGVYTSEARFLDGVRRSETFNVTICEKKRSRIAIVAPVITVLMVFGAMLWMSWKRPSDTNEQGDQQNEAGGENLMPPVQDTESQESTFIKLTDGKPDMENQEEDKEGFKLEDELSCDHKSVC